MIPGVFKMMLTVLKDENIQPQHIRIPIEPLSPYLAMPSFYLTYNPINIIKQWLLNFLWLFNKKVAMKHQITISYFLGVLFSGEMDEKRVLKILPKYCKLAEKSGADIEVLFHPGYMERPDHDFDAKNVVFDKFYLSHKRKTEFDSLMNLQKEVTVNAVS